MKTNGEFLIAERDLRELAEGKIHRLIDCCNFEVVGDKFTFVSEDYEEYKSSKSKGKIIHWLPSSNLIDVEIMMDNAEIISGRGEFSLKNLKEGDIIQLERMFFARVDSSSDEKIVLWYLHK